jgi:hypothetical protein
MWELRASSAPLRGAPRGWVAGGGAQKCLGRSVSPSWAALPSPAPAGRVARRPDSEARPSAGDAAVVRGGRPSSPPSACVASCAFGRIHGVRAVIHQDGWSGGRGHDPARMARSAPLVNTSGESDTSLGQLCADCSSRFGGIARAPPLYNVKRTCQPIWEPRYLVYPGALALPGVGLALASARLIPNPDHPSWGPWRLQPRRAFNRTGRSPERPDMAFVREVPLRGLSRTGMSRPWLPCARAIGRRRALAAGAHRAQRAA